MTEHHPLPGADSATRPALRLAVWRLLAPCVAMLAACSCTLLPKPAPPAARYILDAGMPASAPRQAVAGAPSIAVEAPRAAPGYGSRHMVYMRRPAEIEAFAFHEWVDAPARLLEPMLVRALQDSGGFSVVLHAPSAAASGWRLETELLRLHQDFSVRPSQVRLVLRAVLVDSASRRAMAWREFDVSVPAASEGPVAGALAAQTAAQAVVLAVATFCAEQARDGAAPRR
jgi:cholesterol transport system auxiliary component